MLDAMWAHLLPGLGTTTPDAGSAQDRLRTRLDGLELPPCPADNTLAFPVGAGTWTVSAPVDRHGGTIPVAASGGWLDDHTLRAEIIFLETPHRMDVTCSLRGRAAEAVWRHPPLSPNRLQDLHCPG